MAQAEEQQRAQLADEAREAALQRELEAEQRELDHARFELLLEHEAALRSVVPDAVEAQAELLRNELEGNRAAREGVHAVQQWMVETCAV